MTILVAGLTVATLAAFGLFLDLRLTSYLEASSAAHLHQLADPIIGGMRYDKDMVLLGENAGLGAEVDQTFLSTCQQTTV